MLHAGSELCQAAFEGKLAYLHNLVTYCDLDVDSTDYDQRTALMVACAEGHVDAAVTLVQMRADIHRQDRWGHSAMSEARDHGHNDLISILASLESYHTQNPTCQIRISSPASSATLADSQWNVRV